MTKPAAWVLAASGLMLFLGGFCFGTITTVLTFSASTRGAW